MAFFQFESEWVIDGIKRYRKYGSISAVGVNSDNIFQDILSGGNTIEFDSRIWWDTDTTQPNATYKHDSIGGNPSLIVNGSLQPTNLARFENRGAGSDYLPFFILNHRTTFNFNDFGFNQSEAVNIGGAQVVNNGCLWGFYKHSNGDWTSAEIVQLYTEDKPDGIPTTFSHTGTGWDQQLPAEQEFSCTFNSPIIVLDNFDDMVTIIEGLQGGNPIEDYTDLILNWGEAPEEEEEDDGTHEGYFIKNSYKAVNESHVNREVRWFSEVTRLALYLDKSKDDKAVTATLVGNGKCKYTSAINWTEHAVEADASPWTEFKYNTGFFSDKYYRVTTFATNIPIFKTREEADIYVDTGTGLENNINDLVDTPTVGDIETNTDLSASTMYNEFMKFYILDSSAMRSLYGVLNNTDNYEALKEGTQLIGDYALNALSSLMYMPVNPTLFTTTGQSDIHLGSFNTHVNAPFIGTHKTPVHLGSASVAGPYRDWRDYDITMFMHLPYIGIKQLDTSKYMNRTLTVKFAADMFTGKCEAFLFADGILIDTFPGMLGTPLPISGVNSQEYANNVTGAVRNLIGSTEGTLMDAGAMTANAFEGGGSMGDVAGLAMNVYENKMAGASLVQSVGSVPRFSTGSVGDVIAQLEPQYMYMIFAQPLYQVPANERSIIGLPSNKSGIVGHFSGFLKCSSIKLDVPVATIDEVHEIEQMLASGIYC